MKIAIAQIKPAKGDISANINKHNSLIELASSKKADSIFFPELSLTGYEPELAKDLAMELGDKRLQVFQEICDKNNITIGIGIPTKTKTGIRISMVIFQPGKERSIYSKQQLHSDEFPYFEKGERQIILNIHNKKLAPAICYESLQPDHSEQAVKLGADIYLASVAKPQGGIEKAFKHYPLVAKKYGIPVHMSNCVGFCDNFLSVGQSAVWTKEGILAGQLGDQSEGLLIFDTETEEAFKNFGF